MLYRPTDTNVPYLTLVLKAQLGDTESDPTPFSEELALPAGPYRLEIATANTWGAGAKSGLTATAFTVGQSGGWPAC